MALPEIMAQGTGRIRDTVRILGEFFTWNSPVEKPGNISKKSKTNPNR